MEINNLTFIITDDCNFNCSYCFQKKEKKTITKTAIKTTVDFFYPYLKGDTIYINFYGGEPLLAFEKVKYAVFLLSGGSPTPADNLQFQLTTNGSLLTGEMLDFFDRHKFVLTLSFDGLAQDKDRKKGTLEQMVQLIKKIQTYPGIQFEINSVFSPRTVGDFSKSMRFILEQGAPETTFTIVATEQWPPEQLETLKKELAQFTDYMAEYYKEKGSMPVTNFQSAVEKEEKKKGILHCAAGRTRMAVTPEGKVWGCFLFHDYFRNKIDNPEYRDYAFGDIDDFIAGYDTRYPEILANYAELRQDFFQVEGDFCFLCEEIEGCVICPVNAAYTGGSLGQVTRCKCELEKIQAAARKSLHQKLSG
ncbi:MAG: radical SAM protein [Candidatus Aminicenantes bacterium]|nr:radical SAM protein [Candidatus Aminicenantes bacterium]